MIDLAAVQQTVVRLCCVVLSKAIKQSSKCCQNRFRKIAENAIHTKSKQSQSKNKIPYFCWILGFLKHFTIVVVNTCSQALVSKYMASRMLNLKIALCCYLSMMRRTRMVRYFAFKLWITPLIYLLSDGVGIFLVEKQLIDSQYVDVLGNCQWS